VVFVVDASASMGVGPAGSTRLAEAKEQAIAHARLLEKGELATVVSVGAQPQVILYQSTDKSAVVQAIRSITQTVTIGDVAGALQLAVSLADSLPGSEVFLYSDGSFAAPSIPEPVNATVRMVQVGSPADNQGISAFAIRRYLNSLQAFVQVRNYSASPVTVPLVILADGAPVERQDLTLAPRSSLDLIFSDFPAATSRVDAVLDHDDALPADNRTAAILTAPPVLRALLVSNEPAFLQRVLSGLPALSIDHVRPVEYKPNPVYDLYIFDGWLPKELPPGNWLILNPPDDATIFEVRGSVAQPRIDFVARDSPLLQFADLRDLRIFESRRVTLPQWADTLIGSSSGPLLFSGTYQGRRMVVFSFGIDRSNLPLRTAFPVLMRNIYLWLNPYQLAETAVHYSPGQVVAIVPHPYADHVVVELPSGATITFTGRQTIPFAETDALGIYTVTHRAGQHEVNKETFIVSLLDAVESDVSTRTTALPSAGTALPPITLPLRQELWQYLALAALVLMMVEWFWYHRVRT
jgi:Ca-activated chloride channel family protein